MTITTGYRPSERTAAANRAHFARDHESV